MSDDARPLTDEERAELESLRAEKAQRENARRIQAERIELERLKAEQATHDEDARIRALKERNAKIMEPGDDLKMPLGQKVVLFGVLLIAVIIMLVMALGH